MDDGRWRMDGVSSIRVLGAFPSSVVPDARSSWLRILKNALTPGTCKSEKSRLRLILTEYQGEKLWGFRLDVFSVRTQ